MLCIYLDNSDASTRPEQIERDLPSRQVAHTELLKTASNGTINEQHILLSLAMYDHPHSMKSNKRRRASDDGHSHTQSAKFAAVQSSPPAMFISLPPPRIPSMIFRRRSPLTPSTVTPPAVSISEPTVAQKLERRWSSQRATTLLAKVAVESATTIHSAPSSPRICRETSPECYPFSSSDKYLPETPEGAYVSFPHFEEFSDPRSEDEHEREESPEQR